MKTSLRNVAISALILVITLTLAWNEWTDTDVHESEGVVVIEGELAELEKVVWESEKETITMERRKDQDGEYWWVTHTTTRMVPVQSSQNAAPVRGQPVPAAPGPKNPHTPEAKKQTLEKLKEQKTTLPTPKEASETPAGSSSATDADGAKVAPAPEEKTERKGPEHSSHGPEVHSASTEADAGGAKAVADADDPPTAVDGVVQGDEASAGTEEKAVDGSDSPGESTVAKDGGQESASKTGKDDGAAQKVPAPATAAPAPVKASTPPPKREMEEKVTTVYYKAGINGDELIEKLSPMVALRKLDGGEATFDSVCQKDKLKEQTPKATLTLTIGGKDHEVSVWCQSYGTRDWYVQKIDGGEVFLVDDEVLRTLNQAKSRLADRRLWSFKDDEIVAAVIATPPGQDDEPGEPAQAEHPDAGKVDSLGWKALGKPINSDESKNIRKFMDAFLKLNGSSYRNPDEYEALGLQEEKMLQVKLATEELGEQTITITYDGTDWWGKSEHTHGSLKLVGAKVQSLADMAEVLTKSGTAEPEPAEAAEE